MQTIAIECADTIFAEVLTQMLVYCFHSNSTHVIPVKTFFNHRFTIVLQNYVLVKTHSQLHVVSVLCEVYVIIGFHIKNWFW